MSKYQHLKNEMKRSWKLKSAKIVPVIIGVMGLIKKNLTKILQTIPGNITTNKLQLEALFGLSDNPEKNPQEQKNFITSPMN